MTIYKERIEYKKNLVPYLKELSALTNSIVSENDLLSISKLKSVRKNASNIKEKKTKSFSIPFNDKNEERFNKYLDSLKTHNGSRVFLWTKKTNICGLYSMKNVSYLNTSFPFNINKEGIVVLLSFDIKDKIILDFSLDNSDKKILDIEVVGENWCNAKY